MTMDKNHHAGSATSIDLARDTTLDLMLNHGMLSQHGYRTLLNGDGITLNLDHLTALANAARRATPQADLPSAEFLSIRLARVAKLAGVTMPDGDHEFIAGVAGTILGDIARHLERAGAKKHIVTEQASIGDDEEFRILLRAFENTPHASRAALIAYLDSRAQPLASTAASQPEQASEPRVTKLSDLFARCGEVKPEAVGEWTVIPLAFGDGTVIFVGNPRKGAAYQLAQFSDYKTAQYLAAAHNAALAIPASTAPVRDVALEEAANAVASINTLGMTAPAAITKICAEIRALKSSAPASTAASEQQAGADERAAFEAWGRKDCGMTDESLGRRSDDGYHWGRTADMWAAWKQAALTHRATTAAPEGWKCALHAAVAALYFDDSSDFRSALGAVVRHLDVELAAELLGHPKAAYDKACAMLAAAPGIATPVADQQATHLTDDGYQAAGASLMAAPGVKEAFAGLAADQQGDTASASIGDSEDFRVVLGLYNCGERTERQLIAEIDTWAKHEGRAQQGAAQAQAGEAPHWRPIAEAPRDGTRFWYLKPITVVAAGKSPRTRYSVMEVWRAWLSPGGDGYWTNYATSMSDPEVGGGWFLLSDPDRAAMAAPATSNGSKA